MNSSPISYLSAWKTDGIIDPVYFSSCYSTQSICAWGGESTRRQFSIALKAAHCSWGVFTVCQQWCLAVVALCLHKCLVWWREPVEVTADSTESLTEKAHLLLNMHEDGRYGSIPGSLQLPACAYSYDLRQCCLQTLCVWQRQRDWVIFNELIKASGKWLINETVGALTCLHLETLLRKTSAQMHKMLFLETWFMENVMLMCTLQRGQWILSICCSRHSQIIQ